MIQTTIIEHFSCSIPTSLLSQVGFSRSRCSSGVWVARCLLGISTCKKKKKKEGAGLDRRSWSVTQANEAPPSQLSREPWGECSPSQWPTLVGTGIPPNLASLSLQMWTAFRGPWPLAGELSVTEADNEGADSYLLMAGNRDLPEALPWRKISLSPPHTH